MLMLFDYLTYVLRIAIGWQHSHQKAVMEKIKTLTDKKVELVSTVDQDIIGGFILRLGDQQFDASVANQLKSLEHKLSNRKALA